MSVDVKVHPLVIIAISDHYTRTKANQGKQTVMGCLMGTQSARTLEIMTSFEIVYERSGDTVTVNPALLKAREEQMKGVFPDYDILGWYTTAPALTPSDTKIHRDLCELVENQLIAMTVDCQDIDKKDHKDLPISVFEPEAVIVDGNPLLAFRSIAYRVETLEPERISVDAVARMATAGDDSVSSQLTAHLHSMRSAILMLNSRVTMILNYLQQTVDGLILRAIASLCHRLPVMNTPTFESDYLREYNDGILVTFLTALTNGLEVSNGLVDKFNLAQEKRGRGAGPQMAMFM
ncbi:putative COP9 signalosome complex subunit 6a [Paratrimastix pyriformis]|uniref:COP9 signalosome complex subunit 6 n=1 Tax=Paratrimastix pyriformis TaxID=342808 RepID=A0ABQ8U741_9EUKA|nr:putative COP9 signalosome complex subunit 6a [Paratrimastix pyriformis]